MLNRFRFNKDDDLERLDMNKCPDCECFFLQDNCPICGKECPEEMRAGKRAPVNKKENLIKNKSTEVVFVDWYHHWWFIILMLFVFPIVGIILLATSPHKKPIKVVVITVAVIYLFVSSYGVSNLVGQFTSLFDKPVNTSLSKDEYIALCDDISPKEFYRAAENYKDKFVSMTLTVSNKFTDNQGYYNGNYTLYYICHDANGGEFEIMLRDCIQDDTQNFIRGDIITVYGEGDGNCMVYDTDYYTHTAPCINVAYAVLVK